jgi:hypothetical protein
MAARLRSGLCWGAWMGRSSARIGLEPLYECDQIPSAGLGWPSFGKALAVRLPSPADDLDHMRTGREVLQVDVPRTSAETAI